MSLLKNFSRAGSTVKMVFRALKYRNFRLFFTGQIVSLTGTWIQAVAMSWLVYRMTNSPLLLGVVGFSSQIPTFIFSPFAGIVADRFNKHRILVITQTLSLVQASLLAALTIAGKITVGQIIGLGFFLGLINSFDIPARQSFIVEMVEKKENLGNAIALNSLMFNMARLIGPSIAGVLIAVAGEGTCFLINAVSFLSVIASLLMMKVPKHKREAHSGKMFEDIKNGFSYTFGFLPIRYIILLLGLISTMAASYVVLMPVFAKDILHGDAGTYGFLMASAGLGALAATIYLASLRSIIGLSDIIPVSGAIFSVAVVAFSFSRNIWLSVTLLAIAGFGFMTNMAASNTILQTISDDDKRGRVMSFYAMAFMGTMPIGSLIAGSIAVKAGASITLAMAAFVCLVASAAFASKLPIIRKMVHPIYKKIGIIPEVASGVNTAARLTLPPED